MVLPPTLFCCQVVFIGKCFSHIRICFSPSTRAKCNRLACRWGFCFPITKAVFPTRNSLIFNDATKTPSSIYKKWGNSTKGGLAISKQMYIWVIGGFISPRFPQFNFLWFWLFCGVIDLQIVSYGENFLRKNSFRMPFLVRKFSCDC